MIAVWGFIVAILTQQLRDRTSFFFMLILPVAIIVIIGSSFGGPTTIEIGVVGEGPRADALVDALDLQDNVDVERQELDRAQRDLRRFDIEAAVVVQDDGSYGLLANESNTGAFAARSVIQRVIDRLEAGVAPDAASGIEVRSVGDVSASDESPLAFTSAQNVVLFTFITALTSAVLLVRARTNGILHRALTAPVSTMTIVLGLGSAWLALALLQTLLIIAIGAIAFGVSWGDPLAASALVVLFALVGAGSGLLLGAAIDRENTVGAASAPFALVLAALGGCMVPIEVFPDGLRTLSTLTPHYWALESWKAVMFDGAGLGDIADNLAILGVFAAALLLSSSLLLRRSLVN